MKEGISFCLSLPLDLPGGNVLNPRRLPPVLSPTGDENGWRFNFLTNTINPLFMDVASDDRVILTLQYSTQWDTLAHVGGMFDADGDGVPEPLYYNGFKAGSDVVGPQPDAGRDGCGHMSYAHKLGVENMAAKAIQGRAVMVDLEKHYGARPQVRELRRFQAACSTPTRWWSSRATCCCSTPASPTKSPR